MLELSMIVSLTYDRRRSWTARFCNTRPIKLLGDISMSFYMTHMLAYMLFTAVSCPCTFTQIAPCVVHTTAQHDGISCNRMQHAKTMKTSTAFHLYAGSTGCYGRHRLAHAGHWIWVEC